MKPPIVKEDPIFVFGSNLAGRHGKGAALEAVKTHGAVYGKGIGFYGKSYAIPTKDENLKTLSIPQIRKHVDTFIRFAELNPQMKFQVTRIGCGLAGYEDTDIAPLFLSSPSNVMLPAGWRVMAKSTK